MPAKAGIHDLRRRLHPIEEKSWMPACAGMTVELPNVKLNVSLTNASQPIIRIRTI
jgi:hypothetical protein